MSRAGFPQDPSPAFIIDPLNTPKQSAALTTTLGVCLAVTTVVVGLRVYTKIALSKGFRSEDWLSLLAWVGLVVFCGLLVYQQHTTESGKHIDDLPKQSAQTSIQIINANTIVYAFAFFFTKLSILLQSRRIFVVARGNVADITIKYLMWFHALLYLALFLVCVFQCVPRAKIWDSNTPGRCIDVDTAYIMYGVLNVLSDFLILLWPVHFIRKLQIPLRKKIALCLVFSAGFMGCFTSIMRLVVSVRFPVGKDPTWNITFIALWVVAELSAGIMIGCLPILPRFFRQFCTRSISTIRSSRTQDRHHELHTWPSSSSRPLPLTLPPRLTPTRQHGYYTELDQKLLRNATRASSEARVPSENASVW